MMTCMLCPKVGKPKLSLQHSNRPNVAMTEQAPTLPRPSQHAVSLTVGKLKLMLERLLRVKAAQQALLLVPPEASGAQVGG